MPWGRPVDEAQRGRRRRGRRGAARRRPVGRVQRVDGEHVLDVHEQQLLVLLLVVQAELDEARWARVERRRRRACGHGGVDVPAVVADLLDGAGPAQQAALGAGVPGARLLVVRVEQVVVARVEGPVAGQVAGPARTSRRTRWCGPGATWWGSRRAWTGRPGPRAAAARPGPRSGPGRCGRRPGAPRARWSRRSCGPPLRVREGAGRSGRRRPAGGPAAT